MSEEYSSHRDQLEAAAHPLERIEALEAAIDSAFKSHIEFRPTAYVLFDEVSVEELASAFARYPVLIKSILTLANVAGRAIKRDLGVNIDTYKLSIDAKKAAMLAGYIKPMLPREVAVPSLVENDRYFWTDKEMRANKGRWEKKVVETLSKKAGKTFRKRKFDYHREKFELDGAYPESGSEIGIGVDVKRIEARQDIHKRVDEIVNKASKFKAIFPDGLFYAVVYYPFPSEHANLQSRAKSPYIDGIYFAGESQDSIGQAMHFLADAIKDDFE